MRIAQVAPLWELVPPQTYGGTELVAHLLTEALVNRGHEVTLFAAAGSETAARLVTGAPMALRDMEENFKQDKTHSTVMAYELKMLQDVFSGVGENFDIIHNHMGFQALAFSDFVEVPMVTTLHNALDPEPVRAMFYRNVHLPYISISDYQQKLWPELNYAATIYHGIDTNRFKPCYRHEEKGYFAFLGRLSPEKGPHHAIRIAKALNMKLVMAGKIDHVDRIFYEQEIAHLVDGDQITYIGEVNHEEKVELLRNAAATLCPIEWPEPFGLVMVESMACGTPVFALKNGSIPEVIDPGKTGNFADSVDALIELVKQYKSYDRQQVRQVAENRFSVARMVDEHIDLYEDLVLQKRTKRFQRLTPLRSQLVGSTHLATGASAPCSVAMDTKKTPEPFRGFSAKGGPGNLKMPLSWSIDELDRSEDFREGVVTSQIMPDLSEYYS